MALPAFHKIGIYKGHILRRHPPKIVSRLGHNPCPVPGDMRDQDRGIDRYSRHLKVVKGISRSSPFETVKVRPVGRKSPQIGMADCDCRNAFAGIMVEAGVAGQFFHPFSGMFSAIFPIAPVLTIFFKFPSDICQAVGRLLLMPGRKINSVVILIYALLFRRVEHQGIRGHPAEIEGMILFQFPNIPDGFIRTETS